MQENHIDFLVSKYLKEKDPDAFTKLMQFYMKDMYRVASAILMNDEDASDAIQDTILACWEKIHTLSQTSYFRTWMTRILIRKCYDIRKKGCGLRICQSMRNRRRRIIIIWNEKKHWLRWMKNTALS